MLNALSRHWWAVVVRGVAAILLGLFAWARPDLFWASFVVVVAVYAIVDGVFALVDGITGRGGDRWLQLGEGILGIAVGLVVLVFPGQAGTALVVVIGVWATVTGVIKIASAFRLRREIEGEWLLGTGGVVSVFVGIVLIARPAFGQVTTTYVLETYGIVFGVILIVLGIRLRDFPPNAVSTG